MSTKMHHSIFTYDLRALRSFEGVGHYSMAYIGQFNIKSETVRSTTKLGSCHIARYALSTTLFHFHLPPSHSAEVFFCLLITVQIKSKTVRSTPKLGASHLAPNVKEDVP